jgi:hypothetical protein
MYRSQCVTAPVEKEDTCTTTGITYIHIYIYPSWVKIFYPKGKNILPSPASALIYSSCPRVPVALPLPIPYWQKKNTLEKNTLCVPVALPLPGPLGKKTKILKTSVSYLN